MKTVTVQIGNTDNKLTQKDWANYCNLVYASIQVFSKEIHFSSPSVGWADWQNAAFVFTVETTIDKFILKDELIRWREQMQQDSFAWTEGETEFL